MVFHLCPTTSVQFQHQLCQMLRLGRNLMSGRSIGWFNNQWSDYSGPLDTHMDIRAIIVSFVWFTRIKGVWVIIRILETDESAYQGTWLLYTHIGLTKNRYSGSLNSGHHRGMKGWPYLRVFFYYHGNAVWPFLHPFIPRWWMAIIY